MLLDLPLGLLLVLGGLGRAHEEAEQSLQTIVSSVSDATRWMVYLEGSIVEQEQEQEQESIEGPNLAGWT